MNITGPAIISTIPVALRARIVSATFTGRSGFNSEPTWYGSDIAYRLAKKIMTPITKLMRPALRRSILSID